MLSPIDELDRNLLRRHVTVVDQAARRLMCSTEVPYQGNNHLDFISTIISLIWKSVSHVIPYGKAEPTSCNPRSHRNWCLYSFSIVCWAWKRVLPCEFSVHHHPKEGSMSVSAQPMRSNKTLDKLLAAACKSCSVSVNICKRFPVVPGSRVCGHQSCVS